MGIRRKEPEGKRKQYAGKMTSGPRKRAFIEGRLNSHLPEPRLWIMTSSCYGANQALARGL